MLKDLVDRSLILVVKKCQVCGVYLASVKYPQTAKLDSTCDAHDHFVNTGHGRYVALKVLIVYMSMADKRLAEELNSIQRKIFDEFMDSFKKGT